MPSGLTFDAEAGRAIFVCVVLIHVTYFSRFLKLTLMFCRFNQYVALAVESFSECVVPGLVTTDDLVNNRVDQVVINAELCTGPVNNNVEARQTFESLCESATPSGSQVCDVTCVALRVFFICDH